MTSTNGLNWYDPNKGFSGRIGRTAAESEPAWPHTPTLPKGAPNIIMIVLDDTGFAQLGCYGGLGGRIKTPNIDKLAANGLRYNNWHTTALCSPTRACLLTGRNHHSVGVGNIMEFATGYPGYNAQIPKSAAMLPAVLVDYGYNTMCLGKWHLAPDEHISESGPYDRWPLGQGFERFYGFLPGENDQWHPDLWYDNHRVEPPNTPEEGYHLSQDLVNKGMEWITGQKAVTPNKPFFMYLAFGAHHSPHHAPKEYSDRYKGVFDAGWDIIRQETLAKQKELGIVPPTTELPPRNPGVKAWNSLSDVEKRVLTRQIEVYAGFMTHTDEQIGHLVDFLEKIRQLENTLIIVCSDNGASGEGGPNGLSSETLYFNMATETFDELAAIIERWGLPGTHPHYATGWAMCGNTPQRWYKQQVYEGGVRDPLIVHWSAKIQDKGAIRRQFHHATDIMPTILEAIGLEMPSTVRGYPQKPLEGQSMAYTFNDANAPTTKKSQYFEIFGHRAIWQDGWKAVTFHWTKYLNQLYGTDNPAHDMDFDADEWELFNMDEDFSEAHDLAQQYPEKIKALVESWWAEAGKYQVLPLDDSNAARLQVQKPIVLEPRDTYTFFTPVKIVRSASPDVRRRSHTITAEVEIPENGVEGVIVSNGSPEGGYTLCIKDNRLIYVSNYLGRNYYVITSNVEIPKGTITIRFEFKKTGDLSGQGTLYLNEQPVGETAIERTNPAAYAVAEGLEIGSDGTVPVWHEYHSPFTFTGIIKKVEIEIGSDKVKDPEIEAKVLNYRQ